MAAQQDEINTLRKSLEECSSLKSKHIRRHGDDQFITKGKKKKCEYTSCTNNTEDALIKCNVCNVLVCETCNEIPIAKIKPLMNKCPGVYFACKTCRISNITIDPGTPEEVEELTKMVQDLQATEKSLREEIHSARDNNKSLCARITELEAELTKSDDKLKLQGKMIQHTRKELNKREADLEEQQKKFDEAGNPNFDNIVKLEKYMKNELTELGKSIKESLVREIQENNIRLEEKLSAKKHVAPETPMHEQITDDTSNSDQNQNQPAWNIPRPTMTDFRTIIKQTQNEQMNEANDQKVRARNLIIHGVQDDSNVDQATRKKDDQAFVQSLLLTITLNDLPYKSLQRIGKPQPDRKRPLMLVLNNELDKEKILQNLTKLKDQMKFKGVSVTEDYTIAERKMLTEWKEKAKAKNTEEDPESNFIWRVRGTPKNGLTLKKFQKQKTTTAGNA